jgi:hypothetical protein
LILLTKKLVGANFSRDLIELNYLKSRLEAAPTFRLNVENITLAADRQPFKSTDNGQPAIDRFLN